MLLPYHLCWAPPTTISIGILTHHSNPSSGFPKCRCLWIWYPKLPSYDFYPSPCNHISSFLSDPSIAAVMTITALFLNLLAVVFLRVLPCYPLSSYYSSMILTKFLVLSTLTLMKQPWTFPSFHRRPTLKKLTVHAGKPQNTWLLIFWKFLIEVEQA